ncbi:MAG: response regulator [Candidatus Omnitrophica bacterium]|nr:response regulator [Candidatus Omnitrophota bacterium]
MEKKRILIVDDALFMRNLIKGVVTEAGFEICGEADNALAGVQKYKDLKPDLMTLDIVMPMMEEMDGIMAVKNIISFDSQAKIIVVSSLGDRRLIQEALLYGAKDYVVKPFTVERLLEIIRRIFSEEKS